MNTITTSEPLATINEARTHINEAMRLVLATEGRTLDFETADTISRKLIASLQSLTPVSIILPDEESEDFTDEEWLELEMRLSRDHDDSQFWTVGGAR